MPSPNSPPTSVSRAIVKATSPAPGVAEATGAQRDVVLAGDAIDVALVNDAAVWVAEVEGDRGAPPAEVTGPVDLRGRRAGSMAERSEAFEEPGGERFDVGVDRFNPDAVEEVQADLDGGQVEEIDGSVLEMRVAGHGLVPLALDESGDDRAPENQGRSSSASASRRASSAPTPVGQPNIL